MRRLTWLGRFGSTLPAAAVAVVIVAGVAYATTSSGGPGPISTACVSRSDHALYLSRICERDRRVAIRVAGQPGPQGPRGRTGLAGKPGISGAPGAGGATGPAGAVGTTGAAGAVGPSGSAGAGGAVGPPGEPGNAGPTGPTGPVGATGPAGSGGIANFAEFFALMPGDNAATVAPGTAVDFPQNGPQGGSSITRLSASTFLLAVPGTYHVSFQVSVSEAGQLELTLNGAEQAYTVVGRATGTSQIVGDSLITVTNPASVLTVANPAGESTALTITPLAGGTDPVSASLVIEQLG